MSEGRIVRDPASGIVMVELRHNHAHGSPEQLEAFAGLLIRAAYEARKGMHDAAGLPHAPPLPDTWRLASIAEDQPVRVTPLVETVSV